MSTPIKGGELSPEDPKFYAPPRWRSGAVAAPPIQRSLGESEVPSQVAVDLTSSQYEMRLDEELMADAFLQPSDQSEEQDQSGVRTKVLAIAAGVVVWTAFCVVVGLGRLETGSFIQFRNGTSSVNNSEIPVSDQPRLASLEPPQMSDNAFETTSRHVLTPMLAVADAIGEMNAALPLAIKATNYQPGATINLGGLVAGTTLSAGSPLGESQWRIAVDDLPNAQVIPPADFTGSMTIMAELGTGDNEVLVRTPLQLIWRPTALKFSESPGGAKDSEAVKPEPTPSPTPEFSEGTTTKEPLEQALAWQKVSAVSQTSPRIKTRKYVSRTAKERNVARKRQHSSSALVMETDTVSRWRVVPSSNYPTSAYSDARAERKPLWSDVQALIDRSWDRCKYDCRQRR
jgi:hypothetical protein